MYTHVSVLLISGSGINEPKCICIFYFNRYCQNGSYTHIQIYKHAYTQYIYIHTHNIQLGMHPRPTNSE